MKTHKPAKNKIERTERRRDWAGDSCRCPLLQTSTIPNLQQKLRYQTDRTWRPLAKRSGCEEKYFFLTASPLCSYARNVGANSSSRFPTRSLPREVVISHQAAGPLRPPFNFSRRIECVSLFVAGRDLITSNVRDRETCRTAGYEGSPTVAAGAQLAAKVGSVKPAGHRSDETGSRGLRFHNRTEPTQTRAGRSADCCPRSDVTQIPRGK